MATYQLADNYENYEYIADSDLPRVRTYVGDYVKETDLGITNCRAPALISSGVTGMPRPTAAFSR